MTTQEVNNKFIIKNINTNLCIARKNKTSGINCQCNNLKQDNGFCKYHSKQSNKFTIFDIPDKNILKIYNKYLELENTKPLSYYDFSNKKIKLTLPLLKKSLKNYKLSVKGKKEELILRLGNFFEENKIYYLNENKIILIQKYYRNYKLKQNERLKGEGFYQKNRILNKEDFFTLEPIIDIEDKYFISFKDDDNFIYAFDIRSFKKLVDKKMNNPYNRKPIPKYAIKNLNILYKKLKIDDIENKTILNEKQKMNLRIIKIFQLMDELNLYAGGLNIDWFLNLNLLEIKNLYKHLEDIWNYRAQISQTTKYNIIGNNTVFATTVYNFFKIKKINKCREILLNDMETLLINGVDDANKTLGGLYILTALCNVSPECASTMPWLLM